MDLSRTPNEIASAAAREIRELNHRTLDPSSLQYPAHVADVIESIATLIQRLPQTLDQAQTGLRVLEERGAIRFVDRSLGSTTQQQVSDELQSIYSDLSEARRLLSQVHSALDRTASPLARMGSMPSTEDVEG